MRGAMTPPSEGSSVLILGARSGKSRYAQGRPRRATAARLSSPPPEPAMPRWPHGSPGTGPSAMRAGAWSKNRSPSLRRSAAKPAATGWYSSIASPLARQSAVRRRRFRPRDGAARAGGRFARRADDPGCQRGRLRHRARQCNGTPLPRRPGLAQSATRRVLHPCRPHGGRPAARPQAAAATRHCSLNGLSAPWRGFQRSKPRSGPASKGHRRSSGGPARRDGGRADRALRAPDGPAKRGPRPPPSGPGRRRSDNRAAPRSALNRGSSFQPVFAAYSGPPPSRPAAPAPREIARFTIQFPCLQTRILTRSGESFCQCRYTSEPPFCYRRGRRTHPPFQIS